jgi:chromosomal replication initiator protein
MSVTADTVTLGVVSGFHRDNLSKKFYAEIKAAIQKIAPQIEAIDIIVDEAIDTKTDAYVIDCRNSLKESEKTTKKQQVEGVEIVEGINSRLINDRYRLDNFIIGPSTQLAHAASEAVARKPGASYNPLYLYGNVGLGKTHLLQGTANAIRAKHKNLKVVYTTADRFLTDYVASIK